MKKVIVIAPHPDDETLGCGGTLLKHRQQGDTIHWLIVTCMPENSIFSSERIAAREQEIQAVAQRYHFNAVHRLNFPTTQLDTVAQGELVAALKDIFQQVQPHTVYLPYRGDAHSDHAVVFDTAAACTKWFRQPSVKRVLSYETPSETEFDINPDSPGFRPNTFCDISEHLDEKLAIMQCYAGETGVFPFPRSIEALRALAMVRGATAGCKAAEAFMLLKERI